MKSKISLIGIGMGLMFNASAGEILASKEGPFESYNRCSLSHAKGTLEIRNGLRTKIIETTKIFVSLKDLEELAIPAIAGVAREFYRWFPTQTDYSVRGADSSLVNFYAVGFRNINNESNAAQELISRIDHICNEELTDFRILGDFRVDIKIGSKVFEDKLTIKRIVETFMEPKIEGVYLVPDSFESKIQNLNYKDGEFSFTIRVQEGDDDYKATFEGKLDFDNKLEGKAFILPDRKLLGTFTGKRI